MKSAYGVLLVAGTLAMAACGGGPRAAPSATDAPSATPSLLLAGTLTALAAPPSATASPRPSATPDLSPPFTIMAAQAPELALAGENLRGGSYFVLDTLSGLVEVIAPDLSPARMAEQGGRGGISVAWCGDRLVIANIDGGTPYVVDPSGNMQRSIAQGCGWAEKGGQSPDGRWSAAVMTSGEVSVVVSDARGNGVYRITNAAAPRWSPAGGATLAVLGDLCVGFHVFIFDPDRAELRDVTKVGDQVVEFAWHPAGKAIAVDLIPADQTSAVPRRVLGLIAVGDGSLSELVSLRRDGELIPIGYDAAGARLLFTYNPGRGFCDDGAPPRQKTRLERLGG